MRRGGEGGSVDPKDDRLSSDRTSTTVDLEINGYIYMHLNNMTVKVVTVRIGHSVFLIKTTKSQYSR